MLTVVIPMGTNCDPILADLFAVFVRSRFQTGFGDLFFDYIYPIDLEIKDTTDTSRSASHCEIIIYRRVIIFLDFVVHLNHVN
jgi:hypothetical protein